MRAVVSLFFSGVALAVASNVQAQSAEVAAARTTLAHYDVVGDETLRTIHALGPVARSASADAGEARYLRAIAAADLHAFALVTSDAPLDARVAEAMETRAIDVELRAELRASTGIYRASALDELAFLDVVSGSRRGTSARDGAVFVLAVARALDEPARLAEMSEEAPPIAGLDETTRREVATLRAAHRAFERAARAAHDGDAWLVALAPTLDRARDRIAETTITPRPSLPAALPISAGEGVGGARPDVVLVLGADRVGITCLPSIRVPDATEIGVVAPAAHCPTMGTTLDVAMPPIPSTPQPIEALVSALRDLGMPATSTLALAATADAPAQWIACARSSLARAGVSASVLAFLRPDGAIATTPFAWAPLDDTAFAMVIHVRPGGYAITRGHAHTFQVPRRHDASGFAFDRAALQAVVGDHSAQPVALDALATMSALELVQAARVVAMSGARAMLRE